MMISCLCSSAPTLLIRQLRRRRRTIRRAASRRGCCRCSTVRSSDGRSVNSTLPARSPSALLSASNSDCGPCTRMRTASLSCTASRIVLARASIERACIVVAQHAAENAGRGGRGEVDQLPLHARRSAPRSGQPLPSRGCAATARARRHGCRVRPAASLRRWPTTGRQRRLPPWRPPRQSRSTGRAAAGPVEDTGSGFAAGADAAGRWARLPKSGRRSESANADMA